MAEILVTGGAGFMGAHLVRAILAEPEFTGLNVAVLDDLSGGFESNLPDDDRLTFVEGSITDAGLVDALFAHNQLTLSQLYIRIKPNSLWCDPQ